MYETSKAYPDGVKVHLEVLQDGAVQVRRVHRDQMVLVLKRRPGGVRVRSKEWDRKDLLEEEANRGGEEGVEVETSSIILQVLGIRGFV